MSCPQFIVRSFAVRTAAHLAHLTSTSYARHVALGGFYEALTALVDRYAEVYMGLEGRIKSFPTSPVLESYADDPVALLEEYMEFLAEEMAEDHGSEAMKNILAELEELTATSIYKLKHLR